MLATAQCVLGVFLGAETACYTSLEPIRGGASSASLYRFDHAGKAHVLRLLAPRSSPVRHRHEVSLTRAAGEIGVGPRVHFVATDESAIIYDYTPGQTLRPDDMCQVPVLEGLAQRLSRLHRAKVEVPTATSPFERFYGFEQRAIEGNVPWPRAMTYAAEYVRRLDTELQDVAACPCHLDLHARNIILTPAGDPVLIDWVNGGLSDPAFDVATLMAFLDLRDDHRDHFLASYQALMTEALDLDRIDLLMPIRPFVAAASCLVNIPAEVSVSHLEQELARDELPRNDLFNLNHSARPPWPMWKLGLSLLKVGLSHLP